MLILEIFASLIGPLPVVHCVKEVDESVDLSAEMPFTKYMNIYNLS